MRKAGNVTGCCIYHNVMNQVVGTQGKVTLDWLMLLASLQLSDQLCLCSFAPEKDQKKIILKISAVCFFLLLSVLWDAYILFSTLNLELMDN